MIDIDESGRLSGADLGHDHHGTVVQSSREFEHAGQAVEIRATYVVLVNGVEQQLHFTVGPDGKATTHLRPYLTYDSLVDMVRDIIDHFPDSFGAGGGGDGGDGDGGGDGGHGDGGHGGHGGGGHGHA